jgi:hypothetical protein
MSLRLPEDSGRVVLAIFRSQAIGANEAMRFRSIRDAFIKKDRSFSELAEGLCFLIHHGCLRRGAIDQDAYYLTDLGTALIVRYRGTAFEAYAGQENPDFEVAAGRWNGPDRRNEQ